MESYYTILWCGSFVRGFVKADSLLEAVERANTKAHLLAIDSGRMVVITHIRPMG